MMRKSGVLVAITAAGMLALSPMAFAGDYDGGHGGGHDRSGHHSRRAECHCSGERDGARDHHVGLLGGVAAGVGGLLHGVGGTLHPLLRGLL